MKLPHSTKKPPTSSEPKTKKRLGPGARLLRRLRTIVLWATLAVAWLWSWLALWLFQALPGPIAVGLALAWTAATVVLFLRLSKAKAVAGLIAGIVLIWAAWSLQRPSNDRDWVANQARMPKITWEGDLVTIDNFRYATYRSKDDYDVTWLRRTYDLKDLESVDFLLVPFSRWRGLAHPFLSFGFAGDEYVAVSVEVRKERDESFSPLCGLFRRYELIYVIGDERDLIGLRANVLQDPVYCYPTNVPKEQIRALFASMLDRAEKLRSDPEFYNTITNACGSNVLWHVNQVRQQAVPWQWRVLFPGFSDELAFKLGLIRFEGTLQQARERFRIDSQISPMSDGKAWSRLIRTSGARPASTSSGFSHAGPL